jgi:hypothetical protein
MYVGVTATTMPARVFTELNKSADQVQSETKCRRERFSCGPSVFGGDERVHRSSGGQAGAPARHANWTGTVAGEAGS